MKTGIKTSKLALVCALCTMAVSPVIAAAPVRSLGGTGTYSSASSAASSKTSSKTTSGATRVTTGSTTGSTTKSTRAGVMRVVPSSTKATSSATDTSKSSSSSSGGTTSTRASTTSRLSVGKYLAGNRVVGSTDTSTSPDFVGKDEWEQETSELSKMVQEIDTAVSGLEVNVTALQSILDALGEDVTALEGDLTTLEGDMTALEGDVTALEIAVDSKQDKLTGDSYIVVDGDEVSLDVEALRATLGKNGDTVEIIYDDATKKLSWTINGVVSEGVYFGDFATKQDVENANRFLTAALEKTIEDAITAKLNALTVPASSFADVPTLAADEVAMLSVDENNNRTWVVYKVQ